MLFPNPPIEIRPDFWLLPAFATTQPLIDDIELIASQAPFRRMHVKQIRGQSKQMSVAMTNCGDVGWTSSIKGYAYSQTDPETNLPWPSMPPAFRNLAESALKHIDWESFTPDACLINRYTTGASMGLHQDRDEKQLHHPIVSVSIGASCTFVLGGFERRDAVSSLTLNDGDVLVWGRSARLIFHGVRPLTGSETRYNLTFRRAN